MSLTYNGIAFSYVQTEMHAMGPGMDPSNTDQLYTVIRLRARGQINLKLYPSLGTSDATVADTLFRIRHMLTAPRKPLYYDLTSAPGEDNSGHAILNIGPEGDDANGPIPDADAFSVTYTTPSNLEVTWGCTVKLVDCVGFDKSSPLSLRWDSSVEFDKFGKATQKYRGTAIFSSLGTVSVDEFRRNKLAPAPLPGFSREHSSYSLSADGLRCDFEFVDGQIRYAPPYPIVDMDITQSETMPLLGGMREGEITVAVRGLLTANPADLERYAITVAFSRMNAASPLRDDGGRAVGGAVFMCHETKDSVDASFSIKYKIEPTFESVKALISAVAAWRFQNPNATAQDIFNAANQLSQDGKITSRTQVFRWVGAGTSPQSAQTNPGGYANWATPDGVVGPPIAGLPNAQNIRLFAALLRDPCGATTPVMPNAFNTPAVYTVPQDPSSWPTPAGGAGGIVNATPGAQVSVSVSSLTSRQITYSTPQNDSLYQKDGRTGAYNLWQCANEYTKNPGTLVVPTCNPNGKSAKIRYASDQWVLRRRWTASRTDSWPKIPPTDPPDSNWAFTGQGTTIREQRVAPGGVSIVYEASAVYEYMALDPAKVSMDAAIPPFLAATALESTKSWMAEAIAAANDITQSVLVGGGGGSPLGSGNLPGAPPN